MVKSIWREQKNGLPKGSVLAPLSFIFFTEHQHLPVGKRLLKFADERGLVCKKTTVIEMKQALGEALEECKKWHRFIDIMPSSSKMGFCCFNLKKTNWQTRIKR